VRHTKIIATLGPASDSEAVLDDLVTSGVDVVRLNFSHGTHETHRVALERVRAAARRAGRHVAVLQDLSGPKIRTGALAGGVPLLLAPGERLRLVTGDREGSRTAAGPVVHTSYAGLAPSVHPGDRLLLDDGRIELRVEAATATEIETSVTFGGALGARKGINAPGVALPASAFTPKDERDLQFGLSLGVDFIALSFVQRGDDLARARAAAKAAGGRPTPLIAKIERPQAVQNLDEILRASDGIMIARGDLGLELPLEQVPGIQQEATRRARALGLPVILATQVLDSMRTEPRPTRAEVTDAARAVGDAVDAIMLAGETAVGVAPGHVVRTLATIIEEAERVAAASRGEPWGAGLVRHRASAGAGAEVSPAEALCEAAVTLASRGHAEAIAAITRTGRTARLLAALRPSEPVYAVTGSAETARRLALFWGVEPVVRDIGDGFVPAVPLVAGLADTTALAHGAAVVLVSVDPDIGRPDTNFLKLQRI
jgi:pyruvate kinase